jgi:hypothetical protein
MVCNIHDERFRTRRRIENIQTPHAISVEEAAYNAYKADPQGTTDRLDLADNSNRRELPWWMLVAIVAIAAGVVLVVLAMTAMKHVK